MTRLKIGEIVVANQPSLNCAISDLSRWERACRDALTNKLQKSATSRPSARRVSGRLGAAEGRGQAGQDADGVQVSHATPLSSRQLRSHKQARRFSSWPVRLRWPNSGPFTLGSGTYSLNGGHLVLSSLIQGPGVPIFNFSGTLQASGSFSSSLPMTLRRQRRGSDLRHVRL